MNKQDFTNKTIYENYQPGFSQLKGPLVSVVTTAYKNLQFNKKYFDSLSKQTYKNFEIIFVDSFSPDSTVKDATKRLKNGKVIASKINLGCAGGNNVGAKHAKGEYIFLLGPDTHADPHCIEALVTQAEKNKNYIYTSRQLTYDGTGFISNGISADIFGYPARTHTLDGRVQLRRIFYADGTSVFITRKNYLRIGMMDEATFLFAEDVDLSWKAHMLGMDIVPVPDSVVYHWSGGAVGVGGFPKDKVYNTNTNRRFLAERNIIRNILKNYQLWNVVWILPFYLAVNLLEMLVLAISGQLHAIPKVYLKAYWWNLDNMPSTLEKRRKIQKSRTVNDFGVMKKMSFFPNKFRIIPEIGIPKIN